MLDPFGITRVGEAVRHAPQQTNFAIRLAQQQRPALGRQPVAGKLRHHAPRKMSFKRESLLCTLCHGKAVLLAASTMLRKHSYARENGLFLLPITTICSIFVRNPD